MSLFLQLKDQMIKHILDGTYSGGEPIPTEQELCDKYQISRVTVRKALTELKQEGLIVSVQGQGTMVSKRRGSHKGSLDMIALVAAVHNPFFAAYMEHFERVAEESGSLVLFKQDYEGNALESSDLFYRLFKRNIRNIVYWAQSEKLNLELLHRIRTIGMNLVIFDQSFKNEVADTVWLDNRDAVVTLYSALQTRSNANIHLIGFDGPYVPSEARRQQAYLESSSGTGFIHTIPRSPHVHSEVRELLTHLHQQDLLPGGLICSNGQLGLAAAAYLQEQGLSDRVVLGAIDYYPEMAAYRMLAYRQPMKELAAKSYQRLMVQNNQGELWRPEHFELQGELIVCGE
ncbi:GntR family transcriptional regulator [Paenibacillus roseipurpureus]|uniref:GntR family transcriptional regulator n=1 Tax=Paenibacillus roseopurpureus TaxID=2918901 RepID=A0AA96LM16_9BACL|nr:GntR family transcriptional regulator [Paenibacillus sp. MBLB1832]WNR43469.1 GntR family transcriptional regulator [Paenibacillus sp. MBLB1832]